MGGGGDDGAGEGDAGGTRERAKERGEGDLCGGGIKVGGKLIDGKEGGWGRVAG
ncbi:MAG: hypothetical protein ACT4PL_05100 [Phycisphaerales bacterium]